MSYQPIARYRPRPDAEASAFSRPRRNQADGAYEIHLVKAENPQYVPQDLEVWPLYHQAIVEAVESFPEASEAAFAAYTKVQKQLQGLKNRDL